VGHILLRGWKYKFKYLQYVQYIVGRRQPEGCLRIFTLQQNFNRHEDRFDAGKHCPSPTAFPIMVRRGFIQFDSRTDEHKCEMVSKVVPISDATERRSSFWPGRSVSDGARPILRPRLADRYRRAKSQGLLLRLVAQLEIARGPHKSTPRRRAALSSIPSTADSTGS
jgi:hypothetical protein